MSGEEREEITMRLGSVFEAARPGIRSLDFDVEF